MGGGAGALLGNACALGRFMTLDCVAEEDLATGGAAAAVATLVPPLPLALPWEMTPLIVFFWAFRPGRVASGLNVYGLVSSTSLMSGFAFPYT